MQTLDLTTCWSEIHEHFNRSFASNFHVSISSLDQNGKPVTTPIGSLFLNRDHSAFYFEKYPSTLPENAQTSPDICILAVNSGIRFWLKALLNDRFDRYPGIRLHGTLGVARPPTEKELDRLHRRMRFTQMLKGNRTLWGDMGLVREIAINRAEAVNLGGMTDHLTS